MIFQSTILPSRGPIISEKNDTRCNYQIYTSCTSDMMYFTCISDMYFRYDADMYFRYDADILCAVIANYAFTANQST